MCICGSSIVNCASAQTDRADLAAIAALYRRFQAHPDDLPPPSAADASSSRLDRGGLAPAHAVRRRAASLRVGDRLGSLAGGENLSPSLLFEWSIASVLTQVQSHVLFHAGAVATRGQGILLVGDSGHGKTTLVLALLRRGFRFLSDDVGAIERATGRLTPFPRSLLLRPGTLQRTGFTLLQDPPWLGAKQFVDIEDVLPDSLGEPAPLRWIFFLHNPEVAAAPPACRRRRSAGLCGPMAQPDAEERRARDRALCAARPTQRPAGAAGGAVEPGAPCHDPGSHRTDLPQLWDLRPRHRQAHTAVAAFRRTGRAGKAGPGRRAAASAAALPGNHRSPLIGSPGDVARFTTRLGRLIRPAACFRLIGGRSGRHDRRRRRLVEGS